ncbi:MAG: caffeoyl-CoA O-methyltransferase [Polaribacter sp.]|jgi:caffeoyl-CoA O-methyltransferase
MDFLEPTLSAYVDQHASAASKLLDKIDRDTHSDVLLPQMLAGHMQGRVLSMLSHMIKPERILEIGTYTGYSALCFAEGLPSLGRIDTIDVNEELEERVRGYFKESMYSDKIHYLIGNALDIIPTLKDQFDLVYIDADKENYSNYYDLAIDKVKPGGFIIADNVLWSAKVLNEKLDKDTKALVDYNQKIHTDSRVENVLLPIRDGLLVARKK